MLKVTDFLPTSRAEMEALGYKELDIILISGDAYVDHPSFGTALIGRVLEKAGYRVGIIPQPDWKRDEDFLALGRPRLFFGISSGNMDSMVNHYTAQRKLRSEDAYSPDAKSGKRPDRAVIIYTNIIRRLFKGTPIVLGGIEASLRRIAHYDFWQDKIRNSILSDSKAELIVYGMAEKPILELAKALNSGAFIFQNSSLSGTVSFAKELPPDAVLLPSAEKSKDKKTFLKMNQIFFRKHLNSTLYQENGGRYIRHNPPAEPLTSAELDEIYALPFTKQPHPRYGTQLIPAFEQIKNSIASHRGCYGGCNFCAIAIHQGRKIQSRSEASILSEAKNISKVITDIGGPTANMYQSRCRLSFPASCHRRSCLWPNLCPNLILSHKEQIKLLKNIEALPNIKHLYVASGIRHDLALREPEYIRVLAHKYTGGRLKLAPEHSSDGVLKLMGKPAIGVYEDFSKKYFEELKKAGLKRQIIPYLIVGHPGCTMADAIQLKNWLKKNRLKVEQVQEFTPTPMTISTAMYYSGLDFDTGRPVHVPSLSETRKQKNLLL